MSTLAQAQSRAGHRVMVAPTLSNPGEGAGFLASLSKTGVEVIPLAVSGRGYLREGSLIRKLVAQKHVSVVHTHGYRSDLIGGHAGHRSRVPIVTTVHGFTGGGIKNRTFEALQRLAFRHFDAVVVVSKPQADLLVASSVPKSRIHLIPNALSGHPAPLDPAAARAALGLPAGGLIAGWVGRVSKEKGIDVFIDALSSIGDRVIGAAIFGDGPERASQQARAESIAPGRFQWLGNVADASRFYAAFDLFVMSSHAEGLPMVLLEAMAARIPIVATAVGGIPDLLSPNESMLVPPGDAKALAAAIRATVDDPDAASARAQAAQLRQRAEYDVAPWSARYEALYRHLLGARVKAGARK
ncbi:MAG: glycosyltransferase [Gemmatimonadaceae bacterium]|nr:glycosyltransferase [Gemmatimonadaceae bacterium]